MQKYLDLFKWIVKLGENNKSFSVLLLVLTLETTILFHNERQYRIDIDNCNNRRDSDRIMFQKENKEAYNMLLNEYKQLYETTKNLHK